MFAFELSGEAPRAFTQSGEEVGPRGARNTCLDIPGRVSGCTLLIPKLRACASFRYVIRPHNVSGICIGNTPVLENRFLRNTTDNARASLTLLLFACLNPRVVNRS